MANDQIDKIREYLNDLKGETVSLHAIGDRNRITRAVGILDGVYSDVFTVLVCMGEYNHRYSYTYREIFTKKVKISKAE